MMNPLFQQKIRPADQNTVQDHDVLHTTSLPSEMAATDQEFSYTDNRLQFQGRDLSLFIKTEAQANPMLFSMIARELEKYRKRQENEARKLAHKRQLSSEKEGEIAHILALCDAHLSRLYELLQNRYISLSSGCAVEFDENGQLLLNGVNVNLAIAQYRHNPNGNARVYLQGLARRLYFILGQTHQNRLYGRLQDTLLAFYESIVAVLSVGAQA